MTKQNSQGRKNGVSMERKQPKTLPSIAPKTKQTEDDRETDHRGVVLPRRARIGGIIMPQ